MAKNVYQFVDVARIDPPKKPITVTKKNLLKSSAFGSISNRRSTDRCLDW